MSQIRVFFFLLTGLGWKGEVLDVIESMTSAERKALRDAGAILSMRARLVPGGYRRNVALRPGTRLTQHRNGSLQLRNKDSHRAWMPESLVVMSRVPQDRTV